MLTKIEWVDHSINPIRVKGGKAWPHGYHCTKVSPGCTHCYAESMNMRFGTGLPFDNRKVEFYLNLSEFDKLPKTKPTTVFVQSMGDLFHEDVPFEFIDQIFFKMVKAKRHNFLILTKRPTRMWKYIETFRVPITTGNYHKDFSHIWLGVTAENQEQADKRIPILLQIPAAKRFVSIEPMLGAVDFKDYLISCKDCGNDGSNAYIVSYDHQLCGRACKVGSDLANGLDWIIVGAESGPKRRWMDYYWAINVVDQCKAAGVPVFVKQVHRSHTGEKWFLCKNIDKWPEDLRVRQYPD